MAKKERERDRGKGRERMKAGARERRSWDSEMLWNPRISYLRIKEDLREGERNKTQAIRGKDSMR